jgi:hypothetical protein
MLAPGHFAKRPDLQSMQPATPPQAFGEEIPSGPVSHHFSHAAQPGSDAMAVDGGAPTPQRPSERPPLWHTHAQVAGGPAMSEFTQTMKDDAAAQEHIIELLGTLLDKTVQRNDGLGRKSDLPEFEAGKACPLTASAYLKRIMKYGCCSPCCVVVGLIYLQRLKQRNPTVCLTSGNMQRLLLTSVMVAAKFLDDLYYSNKHWARIGGLNLQELNTLELKLLFQLSFSLCINREEYQEYLQGLIGAVNVAPPAPVAPPAMEAAAMRSHVHTRGSVAAWQGGDTPMAM